MSSDAYEKFYNYLNDLQQSYEKLSHLLQEKMDAVSTFDMNKLDEIMKNEQVYVLLSKGFESNMNNYRQKLGLTGSTLTEQLTELPDDWQKKFLPLSRRLRETLDLVKDLNDKCQLLLETKLYSLDKSIQELDKSQPGLYNKAAAAASESKKSPHMLMKSI